MVHGQSWSYYWNPCRFSISILFKVIFNLWFLWLQVTLEARRAFSIRGIKQCRSLHSHRNLPRRNLTNTSTQQPLGPTYNLSGYNIGTERGSCGTGSHMKDYFDDLVQGGSNSSALAMELLQYCNKPSILYLQNIWFSTWQSLQTNRISVGNLPILLASVPKFSHRFSTYFLPTSVSYLLTPTVNVRRWHPSNSVCKDIFCVISFMCINPLRAESYEKNKSVCHFLKCALIVLWIPRL